MTDAPSQVDILKIWRYLAIFAAALIIHSLIRFFLAPEAKSLILTIGSILVFLPLLWLSLGKSIESLRYALKGWQWLIFLLLLIAGILIGTQNQRDLLYIHANLVYWPFAVFFYQQIYSESKFSLLPLLLISLLILILVSIVRLLGLSYFPNYQLIDEPWVFSMLMNHLKTGSLGDPLYYGRTVDAGYFLLPWAYWMRLGEPSLWFGRLYHFLLFLPFCGFLGLAAYHLYGKVAGILSFFAAFACATLYWSVHLRHDLELLSFIAPALAAYAYGLKRRAWLWHGIAGALIGLSLFAHYHAVALGPMFTIALYVPLYLAGKKEGYLVSKRDFFAFIIGGALGGAIVFFTNILPLWSSALEAREWRGIVDPLTFPSLYMQYLYLARLNIFEQLLTIGALAMLFYKADAKDKVLIWLYFIGPAMLAIIARGGYAHYSQHIAPVYALMIGRAIQKGAQLIPIPSQALSIALGIFLIAPMLGSTTPLFVLEEQRPLIVAEPPTVTWVKENLPAGSVIVGPDWYYFFLYEDYQYYSLRSWQESSAARQASYNNDARLFWDEVDADAIILWEKELMNPFADIVYIDESYLLERGYERITLSELMPIGNDIDEVRIFLHP